MKKILTALLGAAIMTVVLAGCSTAPKQTEPPPAPVPKAEPAPMPPADTDGDGVPDSRDNCPNTPKGTKVDANGCPEMMAPERMELKVLFDFDSAQIRPQYHAALGDVSAFMKKHKSAVATLEGHTDSIGTNQYNQGLSERRANSVRDYLVKNEGIAADRIKTVGYGESRPVATNETREGRQKNRRVIAVIIESK
ncbi:MAG: OmpA family protein [Gammaproteobacteria bacterium]|nr:OmpA family protein [Gammaproteobacteria bacterium]